MRLTSIFSIPVCFIALLAILQGCGHRESDSGVPETDVTIAPENTFEGSLAFLRPK